MPTYSEAGTMSVLAYHTTKVNGVPTLETGFTAPAGWSLFDVIDHTSTDGDHAAIFKNDAGTQYFYAGRGTATFGELLTDTAIVAGQVPEARITDAKNNILGLREAFPDAVVMGGGHSLDGEVLAKVSERIVDDGGQPFYVLALNPPNTFATSSLDENVVAINAQYDIVGHWGVDYSNFITLDTNPTFSFLNQLGSNGTHSVDQLVFEGIHKNPALANSEMGQPIDIQGVVAGGNVRDYQVPGFNGNNIVNDSVSLIRNPDGSLSEVVTTYFSDGSIKSIRTINIEADGDGASTTENGQGQVISTETLDVNSDAHTQFFDKQNFDSDGELQSEGTFSVVANGEAFANIKGQGFGKEMVSATVLRFRHGMSPPHARESDV